jgi:hypothetical protein
MPGAVPESGHEAASHEELRTVRSAVVVLPVIRGVASCVALTVLGDEYALCVVSPSRGKRGVHQRA